MAYTEFIAELESSEDPWDILAITRDAEDAAIRAAFEKRYAAAADDVKKRKILDAYEKIRTAHRRFRLLLLSPRPLESAEDLLNLVKIRPRYAGPGIWLKNIREVTQERDSRDEHP